MMSKNIHLPTVTIIAIYYHDVLKEMVVVYQRAGTAVQYHMNIRSGKPIVMTCQPYGFGLDKQLK